MNKKDRRHSGRVQPTIYGKVEDVAVETLIFWDDWTDRRDGMRNIGRDKTLFVPVTARQARRHHDLVLLTKNNWKLKKHERIRRIRKGAEP